MLASTQYSHNILSTFTIFIYIHLKQPVKAEGVAVEWLDRGVATTKKSHILGTTKNLKASFERCRDLISGGACSGRTEEKKNIYIYIYIDILLARVIKDHAAAKPLGAVK